jgi:hypothetical protein
LARGGVILGAGGAVCGGEGGWPWRAQASIGVVFDVVLDRLILDGEEKDGQMGEENKFS